MNLLIEWNEADRVFLFQSISHQTLETFSSKLQKYCIVFKARKDSTELENKKLIDSLNIHLYLIVNFMPRIWNTEVIES